MRLNNEILAGLIDGSPYPIYLILGEELTVAVANAATLEAWGKDKSVIGKPFSEALPELKDQPFESLLRKVMQTGEPYRAVNDRAEFLINGKKKVSYFTFSYQPLKDEQGEIIGVVCYATDVTGLVESAAELTESYHMLELSELRFRNLIQQAPFAMCVISASDLIVTDLNERYLELVGKTRAQLEGFRIWDAVPEAADTYGPIMQQVIASNRTFSAKEAAVPVVKNGVRELIYVDFTYEPVVDLSGEVTAVMVLGIDVSEKVNIRRATEEMEERIRLAVDAGDIGTYEYRFDTDDFVTTERFNEIVGLSGSITREDLINQYHPDDRKLSAQALQTAKAAGRIFYEARLFQQGSPMKWVRFQAKVYYGSDGNPTRTLGTAIDITQYKALQQQKDDFISIASHELKTPITSLKAALQLLSKMKEQINPVLFPKLLDQAMRNMAKITALVDDLLDMSKLSQAQIELKKASFHIGNMLENSCCLIQDSAQDKLLLKGDLELMVHADEHRIEQVIVNLVNNAIKYAPDSAQILVDVKNEGDVVKVTVEDFGPGIATERLSQLFDRYYRADASGKQVSGLGLGLYISAEIIKRHGGEIGVESIEGQGSRFWFTLPLS